MAARPRRTTGKLRSRVCLHYPAIEAAYNMMIRTAKLLLLAGVALFYILVVFNNLTDFGTNAQFVRHVLLMDTTIPGNGGMWRSISSPAVDRIFYMQHHCLGNHHGRPALVGHCPPATRFAPARCSVQRGQIPANACAHALLADVARGVSRRRRRVVSHVAVTRLERAGGSFQMLHCDRYCVPGVFASRHGRTIVGVSFQLPAPSSRSSDCRSQWPRSAAAS